MFFREISEVFLTSRPLPAFKSPFYVAEASITPLNDILKRMEVVMQGRFRKHALAVAIALACPTLALQAAPDRPNLLGKPAAEAADTQRYLVKLQRDADFGAVLAKAGDGARFERRSRLVPEYFWMTLSPEAAAAMKARPGVESVLAAPIGAHSQKIEMPPAQMSTANVASGEIPPLSNDPEAGKGVRVAVVSTGMDYTHAMLGGAGTKEAYEEALANHAALYDGFPNAVVTGGFDANSENSGFDPNPIENSVADADMSKYPAFPVGRGTLLGSLIHELAPGAELLAYKIYRIQSDGMGHFQGELPDAEVLDRAFTHIVDPDGDGDYSDRAHIALIDSFVPHAFYDAYDNNESGNSLMVNMVQALAAKGVLVVTDTGMNSSDSPFTMSWLGGAPDGLTVGAIALNEEGQYVVARPSARGPVRGPSGVMKPDMVSYGFNVTGAAAGTSTETTTVAVSTNAAAARVAAAAAILKAERSELSALDLKAMLANTASHDILRQDIADETFDAEVPHIGLGRENLGAAATAGALVRTEAGFQPSLNFGFEEFDQAGRLTRRLVVRNLSGSDQSFSMTHSLRGEKTAHEAISLEYPSTVFVPANKQVAIDVAINVDPAKLPAWPLRQTSDYTEANWRSVQLNGYFTLTSMTVSDNAPPLSMAWMITPRARIVIDKDFATYQEHLESWDGKPPELALADGFVEWGATGYSMEFSNAGTGSAGFAALPMIVRAENVPEHLKTSSGHKLRYVSGGVFPEAACGVTGQKLVIATTMHEPAEIAKANYFDKIGDVIFTYSIIREQTVIDWGLDQTISQSDLFWMADEDFVTHSWVTIDQDGKPVTIYIDLDQPYDSTNPSSRYRTSTLPTYFAAHSRNVISQICVEDILHHEMQPEELNKNVGLVIGTDRMTLPEQYTPVIQFNPTRYGYMVDCNEWDCWYNGGAKVTLEPAPAEGEPAFNHMLEVAAGERVKLTAVKEDVCDAPGFGFGPPVTCNRRFVLMGLNGDFALGAKVSAGDEDTVIPVVREGQRFNIDENLATGELIGRIKLDSEAFFALGNHDQATQWFDFLVYQDNALPGDPFLVQPNGDLVVNNAGALDYEMNESFTLQVRARDGMDSSRSADVMVYLRNLNDLAPSYTGGLTDITFKPTQAVSINVVGHFMDHDGDSLTIATTGLPGGVFFNPESGKIEGAPATAGIFDVTVTASDGVHDTAASFKLTIEQKKSGGGSSTLWFLLTLLMTRFARLHKQ